MRQTEAGRCEAGIVKDRHSILGGTRVLGWGTQDKSCERGFARTHTLSILKSIVFGEQ